MYTFLSLFASFNLITAATFKRNPCDGILTLEQINNEISKLGTKYKSIWTPPPTGESRCWNNVHIHLVDNSNLDLELGSNICLLAFEQHLCKMVKYTDEHMKKPEFKDNWCQNEYSSLHLNYYKKCTNGDFEIPHVDKKKTIQKVTYKIKSRSNPVAFVPILFSIIVMKVLYEVLNILYLVLFYT